MEQSLDDLIRVARIPAGRDVIVMPEDKTVVETMHQTSRNADVVFLGLPAPQAGEEDEAARRLQEMVDKLPTTVMVRNSGPLRGSGLQAAFL